MQRHVARSESHGPAPVSRWEACRFTAHRKRLERLSTGSRMERSDHEASAVQQHAAARVLTVAARDRCSVLFA
ncbi:MAG: hypothetical protein LBQ54_10730 [Planctomycetaceae bacterium]|nr:hypothetical protein [Planctomycetaceae bacterium]